MTYLNLHDVAVPQDASFRGQKRSVDGVLWLGDRLHVVREDSLQEAVRIRALDLQHPAIAQAHDSASGQHGRLLSQISVWWRVRRPRARCTTSCQQQDADLSTIDGRENLELLVCC
jgi:hypothetical protein